MSILYALWFIPAVIGAASVWRAQRGKGSLPLKLTVTGSILLLIIVYAFFTRKAADSVLVWGLFCALAASMVGDFFLSSSGDTFIHGVAGFFVAHTGYLIAFLSFGGFNLPSLLVFSLILLLYLLLLVRPQIQDRVLFWAVCGYTAISALVIGAAFGSMQLMFIVGALLIALSDCCIAWNTFVRPFRYAELVILSTYYSAQISIGLGCWYILS